jgi:hypothetical protein
METISGQIRKVQRAVSVLRDKQNHQQIIECRILDEVIQNNKKTQALFESIEQIRQKHSEETTQNLKDTALYLTSNYINNVDPSTPWSYILMTNGYIETNLFKSHVTIRETIVDMKSMGVDISDISKVLRFVCDKAKVLQSNHRYSIYVIFAGIINYVYCKYVNK